MNIHIIWILYSLNVGQNPFRSAFTPDGKKIYVTSLRGNTTSVIDTSTNKVIANVSVGESPDDVAVTPDGNSAYVTNWNNSTVTVIDTGTNTVTAKISVGISPHEITVSPDGTKIYVTNYDSNSVSVIDTITNQIIATVPVGINPMELAVTPGGAKVFVTNSGSGNISVIDTATNKVTTVNSGKYDIYFPVCVAIVHATDSDAANQSIKAALNTTIQNKKEIPNTTDIGAVEESRKNSSAPDFGLLGGLTCPHSAWKLRKSKSRTTTL